MRVSREQAAENRRRIVKTAGHLFREKGYDGIGVADLMKAAGLTHGGFYGHFKSKDDLAAEAVREVLTGSVERWRARMAAKPEAKLEAIFDYYLSQAHRDAPANGCAVAALASDTARQPAAVRQAYGDGVSALIDVLADAMPETSPDARRRSALAAFSQMAGAVMMARAVGDDALSDEILAAARAAFLAKG